jgi:hypothetical protein
MNPNSVGVEFTMSVRNTRMIDAATYLLKESGKRETDVQRSTAARQQTAVKGSWIG